MNGKKKNYNLNARVTCALLITLIIILSHFLAIQTPAVRISFAFIPLALSGMMFGPAYGFAVGASSDILGVLLFNNTGGFPHPGFTAVAAMSGMLYGLLLYEKAGEPKWDNRKFFIRVLIVTLIINIPLELGLNTLWLTQILGKGFLVIVPARAVKQLAMIAVECALLPLVRRVLEKPIAEVKIK